MYITVTVTGEPDTAPYVKRFQFEGPDDYVLAASYKKVKDMLERGMRININETVLLFSVLVVSSLIEKKTHAKIKEEASSILSPVQVMIGVPEMLQRLDFETDAGGSTSEISIKQPIPAAGHDLVPQDRCYTCS